MLLQDLFAPGRIKVPLESQDKDEVFEELVDVFVTSCGLNARDEILRALYERENKMSTGIKSGIAFPHGKTAAVRGLCGVIGISKTGIEYDALDGRPVSLVFMIISSPESSELHLKTLRKLAFLLDNPDFYLDMVKSGTREEAFSVLKRYEEILEGQD